MPRKEPCGSHVKRKYKPKTVQISTEYCSLLLLQELNPVGKQSTVIWGSGTHINVKALIGKYFRGKEPTEVVSSLRKFKEYSLSSFHIRPQGHGGAKAVRTGCACMGQAGFCIQLDSSNFRLM